MKDRGQERGSFLVKIQFRQRELAGAGDLGGRETYGELPKCPGADPPAGRGRERQGQKLGRCIYGQRFGRRRQRQPGGMRAVLDGETVFKEGNSILCWQGQFLFCCLYALPETGCRFPLGVLF